MFKNTGDLSFYLGISVITLAFLWLLFIYILVAVKSIDQTKVDKLIDVGKWFFVSIAIVVGATIINDGFKEREEDIKEIEIFGKYVSTITEADGIEKRWLLAEYFSIVAPPGELRKSWESYKAITKPQLEEHRANIARLAELNSIKNPTTEAKQEIVQLDNKIKVQEKSLVSQSLPVKPVLEEWLIIVGNDTSLEAARDELNKARKVSPDARIYKKGSTFTTVIPNLVSRDEAIRRLPQMKLSVNSNAYILKDWCTSVQDTGDFLVCN